MLALEVNELLRIGLPRKYVEKREPLEVIRGRPVWERNFPWRGAEARELVCRHSRITYDNLDNQIVLAGLRVAMQMVQHKDVRKDVTQTLRVFQQLATERVVDSFHFDQVKDGYNRLNEHYEAAHHITRMLLYGLRSRSVFSEGSTKMYGLALDMPSLFEKFTERLIATVLQGSDYKLFSLTSDRGALLDGKGQTYASVRPDYQVRKGNELIAVLDAKYKDYWPVDKTGLRPNRKVGNEDLYQLFFYQQRLRHKYRLMENPPALIISQLPDDDERDGRQVISDAYRRVVYKAGEDRSGDINIFFIPVTRFLRLLNQGATPIEAAESIDLRKIVDFFQSSAA
jgi:5-methylcytosine-specific restriction enzyme subunit McrC